MKPNPRSGTTFLTLPVIWYLLSFSDFKQTLRVRTRRRDDHERTPLNGSGYKEHTPSGDRQTFPTGAWGSRLEVDASHEHAERVGLRGHRLLRTVTVRVLLPIGIREHVIRAAHDQVMDAGSDRVDELAELADAG